MATFGAEGSTTRRSYLDRFRVVFNLDREAMIVNGYLDSLMADLETFDSSFGTDEVAQVQNLLTEIEDLNDAIAANESGSTLGATMVTIPSEVSIQYRQQGGNTGDIASRNQRYSKIERLKAILDPRRTLESRYQASKVIGG